MLPSGIVLTAEWVSSKHRVLSNNIISFAVIIGETILALAAMYFQYIRTFLLVLYAPGLLGLAYFWILPESVRWLYATGRADKAEQILKSTAKANKKEIAQKTLDQIRSKYEVQGTVEIENNNTKVSLLSIFKSKMLILRLISLSFCWLVNVFVYNGLGILSTKLEGDENKYLSFIIVAWAELPSIVVVYFILDRIGRRATLCGSYLISGAAIILSAIVPDSSTSLILIFFLISKCAITSGFMAIYIYTAELWPTSQRQTMMGLCSMVGRIGGMLAPVAVYFVYILPELPSIIFGSAGIFAGILILFSPETLGKKLPDTIEEVKALR